MSRSILFFCILVFLSACDGGVSVLGDENEDNSNVDSTSVDIIDERSLLDLSLDQILGLSGENNDPFPIGAARELATHSLARGQTATQSSTSFGGVAGRAVDGKTSAVFSGESVTATARERNPWWQVDLSQNYMLSSISIANRSDCCSDRLSNFYIFVSDEDMRERSFNDLLNDTSVWRHHEEPAVAVNADLSVELPTSGRFVRIQKATTGILSLAEVAVYGRNLAVNKPATQSSVAAGAVASRATDGNRNGFHLPSISSTQDENEPWWQLDLGEQTKIGKLKLFNRRDCCTERLSHFYVFVSETDMTGRSLASLVNDPQIWKSFEVAGVGNSYVVEGSSRGRFVRVQRNTTGILALTEVVVYGAPASQADNYKTNPAIYGEWSTAIEWPHIPVHAGLLPSGKILSYDATPDDFTPVHDPVSSPNNITRASLWDITTGIHKNASNHTGDDLFCSGHTLMADGNYFAAGGTTGYNQGINSTNIFNSTTEIWSAGPKMETPRWYPAVTNLANGELLIAGGQRNSFPEIYNPVTGAIRTLTGDGLRATGIGWPFLMQAPNGRVIYAGGAGRTRVAFVDTEGDGSLTETSSNVADRNHGSFVSYDIGQMLVTGGAGQRSAVTVEMNTARVSATKPMHFPRQDHNALALPDGSVIAIGGNLSTGLCKADQSAFAPEIWDPASGDWTLLAAQQHPRQYHSTAVLLPDATVWSGGQGYATVVSNQVALCSYQNNAEIYSPPYLFNTDGSLATRPVITAAPEQIDHDQAFTIAADNAASIESISLIRLSTTTHAANYSQRFVPLTYRQNNPTRLLVDAPRDANIAPAGFYMLFILNNQGTPSVAKIVKLGSSLTGALAYNLDFGTETSPVEPGWIKVTPSTTTSLVTWELNRPNAVDRGTVNNGDNVERDLVFFNRDTRLNLNVGNGNWRVKMRVGDKSGFIHDQVTIRAEGAVINDDVTSVGTNLVYVGTNTTSLTEASFDVEVTDGSLTIELSDNGGRDSNWVLNSLQLQLLQDQDISAPIIQSITPQDTVPGTPVSLTANATGIGQLQYSWNFGDNTQPTAFSASNSSINYTYSDAGRYIVTVTARDATGFTSSRSFTQIVSAAATASEPVRSTSIMEYSQKSQVWNVNPDNNSVTVIDTNQSDVIGRIDVGHQPVNVALAPTGSVWVVNKKSATVSVINADSLTLTQTITLPTGSAPHGLVFDDTSGYLALEGAGSIVKLNASSGAIESQATTEHPPRHLSLAGDKSRLYATVFITPPLPSEHTLSPVVEDQNGKHGGEVLVYGTPGLQSLPKLVMQYIDQPASDTAGPGIPNYLGAMAISPDGETAWVPSKQDNILNGELRTGDSLRFDQAVRAISSKVNLNAGTDDLAARIDHDNASIASHAVFDKLGTLLFTTLEGNRQVAVSDVNRNVELLRFDVGRAPQGLVVSDDNTRLYVHNFMDRSIGVYDISDITLGRSNNVPQVAVTQVVATDLLSASILQGKKLFYDAQDDRLAAMDYMSCASCHNEGGHDGRVWDFSQFGEGLRNTSTLKGRGGPRHGFLHWSANFDEVQDFEAQIRGFAGGTGLMSNAAFNAGTRSEALGDPKAGISDDLDALAAYVNSLTTAAHSPHRLDSNDAGEALFTSKGCIDCHSGSQFTDSATGDDIHDIGSIKLTSGQRLSGALNGIDTPGLLGVWETPPYLHDGSAATLEEAIAAHAGIDTSNNEQASLARYIRSQSYVVRNFHTRGVAEGSPTLAANDHLTIDSIDDNITLPHSDDIAVGNGDFSVSFWMQLQQGPVGQWRSIVHKGSTNGQRTFALWLRPESNRFHYSISTSERGNTATNGTTTILTDEWVHVAYVKRGTEIRLYVNGLLDSTNSLQGQVLSNTGDLMIGKTPWFQPALATYADFNIHHYAIDQVDINAMIANFSDGGQPVISPATPAPQSTNNLLTNGGFEQGKAGWNDCSNVLLTTLSQDSFDGVGAISIQNQGCLFQEFAVSAGRGYQLNCHAKSGNNLYTSVTLAISDADFVPLANDEIEVTGGNSYQRYESTLTAPALGAVGVVTLYSDDVAVFDSCEVNEL